MNDKIKLIEVKEDIRSDNAKNAMALSERLKREKTFFINLMASPGAGKTSLLLQTIKRLKQRLRIGVMEADIDSMVDAEKIAEQGVEAIQVRTGGFCHMDASMVKHGIEAMNTKDLDLLILENVGNLVCPAEFETGAHKNVMILSVPEGDDKPLKYPLMFSVSHVLIINKIDYLPFSDFNIEKCRSRVLKLNPDIQIIELSCKTGEGIDEWIEWLYGEVNGMVKANA